MSGSSNSQSTSRTITISAANLDSLTALRDIDVATLPGFDPAFAQGSLQNYLLKAQELARAILELSALPTIDQLHLDLHESQSEHQASQVAIAALRATNDRHEATIDIVNRLAPGGGGGSAQKIPDPKKFDGTPAKYRQFISNLRLKLMGDERDFPTPLHRLQYAYNLLEGDASYRVRGYITRINGQDVFTLGDVDDLIKVLGEIFEDPKCAKNALRNGTLANKGNRLSDGCRWATERNRAQRRVKLPTY